MNVHYLPMSRRRRLGMRQLLILDSLPRNKLMRLSVATTGVIIIINKCFCYITQRRYVGIFNILVLLCDCLGGGEGGMILHLCTNFISGLGFATDT